MGKLLRNTLNWLAAPSLGNSSSGIGGYATPPDRLTPYNDRPAVWGGRLGGVVKACTACTAATTDPPPWCAARGEVADACS